MTERPSGISQLFHKDKQFIEDMRKQYAFDFLDFRRFALQKYALKLRQKEQSASELSASINTQTQQVLYTQAQSTLKTQESVF